MNTLLNALVPAIGWSLLHFVWQGLLIGWAASLALHLLRNAQPQTRYAVACGALLLAAVLPLASIAWRVADALAGGTAAPLLEPLANAAAVLPLAEQGVPVLLDADQLTSWEYVLRRQIPWLVLLWAAGAALMTLRLSMGLQWVRERTLAGHFRPDPAWQATLERLAQRFGITRTIRLGVSEEDLEGPMTAGIWRPIVLLPASLVTGMPPHLLEALLAHELAHIKRHDYLVNLIQSAIEILLFYHPVVWKLSQRIRIEREQIADDLAASMLGEPRRLALALSELDKFQFTTSHFAPAAHGGDLMSRIKRLVRPDAQPLSWKMAAPLLGIFAACAVFYAHANPALVADAADAASAAQKTAAKAMQVAVDSNHSAAAAREAAAASQEAAAASRDADAAGREAAAAGAEASRIAAEAARHAADAARAAADMSGSSAADDDVPPAPLAPPAPPAPPAPVPKAPNAPKLAVPAVPAAPAAPAAMATPALPPVPAAPPMPMYAAHAVPPAPPAAPMPMHSVPPAPPAPRMPRYRDGFSFDGTIFSGMSNRGDSYALVRSGEKRIKVSAERGDLEEIKRLQGTVSGDFIWFRKEGKAYLVQNPALVAKANAAWEQSKKLGAEMEKQGDVMRQHGDKMRELGDQMRANDMGRAEHDAARETERQMRSLSRPMERIGRQMEALGRRMETEDSAERREALSKQMAELQAKLGPMQEELNKAARELAAKHAKMEPNREPMRALQEKMKVASEPMRELGRKMGEMGREQGRLSREADRATRDLIEEAIRSGQAVPLEHKAG